MNLCRVLLIPVTLAVLAMPASAGVIFGKRPAKPNPADRVPELILTVKTDPDEHKRVSAAEELRQFDPAAFPEIVPVLVDVLRTDTKASVRAEAATSLSKLRPVNPQSGLALEQAQQHDASMRVRLQARSALLMYHWAGYHSGKPNEGPAQTKEPPMVSPSGPEPVYPPTATQTRMVPTPVEPPIVPTPASAEPRLLRTPPSRPLQGPDLTPP